MFLNPIICLTKISNYLLHSYIDGKNHDKKKDGKKNSYRDWIRCYKT